MLEFVLVLFLILEFPSIQTLKKGRDFKIILYCSFLILLSYKYNPGTHSSLIKAGNPIFEMLLGHQSQGLIFSKDKEKKSLKKV